MVADLDRSLVALLALLCTAAFITGAVVFLAGALVPIVALVAMRILSAPMEVTVERHLPEGPFQTGGVITFEVTYSIPSGFGSVEIHQPLPDVFELIEGNNLHFIRKGLRKVEGLFRFTVRSPRRGKFVLDPIGWRSHGFGYLDTGAEGAVDDDAGFMVKNDMTTFKRVLNKSGRSVRIFPDMDPGRTGITTTDFREIREYAPGDSPRTINWKATAKSASRAPVRKGVAQYTPLVNEFEVEGKKNVWIFLDAHPNMSVGTSVENGFEEAIKACEGMARFFVDRGYRVGFSVYNHPEEPFLYPDLGMRQFRRIQRELQGLEVAESQGLSLLSVIQHARPFLQGGRALMLVVTRAEAMDEQSLQGVKKLRASVGTRRSAPVLVVSPDCYDLIPGGRESDEVAREIVRALDRNALRQIHRAGAEVIRWNPRKSSLHAVFLRRLSLR